MVYLTSDLHLCHDREFIYKPRGFSDILAHDLTIIENINNVVDEDDTLYILGDLMLNDIDFAVVLFNKINCKNIHVILGNHDTDSKIEMYKQKLNNVKSIKHADVIKYGKYRFYLSHYPTMTGNLENRHLSEQTLNLFGHTHSKDKFFEDRPYMYNVALNANDNKPVSIEDILKEMRKKKQECLKML